MDGLTLVLMGLFCVMTLVMGAVILAGAIWWVRKSVQKTRAVVEELAQRLGLEDHNPQGFFPDLRGEIDGIKVIIDTHYQLHARAGSSMKSSLRPWMRVRAELPVAAQCEVRSRGQKMKDPSAWPAQNTGDAEFDTQFEVFAPNEVELDRVLPADVRQCLMGLDLPLHIMPNFTMWVRYKMVNDADFVERVVRASVRLAQACRALPTPPDTSV